MIRKTISITSLAILVAAISVATTMTMVQADPTGDFVDISVPLAVDGTIIQEEVVAAPEYDSPMIVVDAELLFTDGDGLGTVDGTIDHIDEISINNAGSGVHTGTFTFETGAPDGTVNFVDTGDNIVQLGELTVGDAGTGITDLDTATLTATEHLITVDIDDGMVEILLASGPPTTAPILITIDDIQWVGETGAIGSFVCAGNIGATSTPLFDKDTLTILLTGLTVDLAIDIDCVFVAFHGDVEKELTGDCLANGVKVKRTVSQQCTFRITYDGDSATIIDTLPAEWRASTVAFNPDDDTCEVDEVAGKTGKNKKQNSKSATGITCEDLTTLDIEVTVDTRQSPSGKLKFKPTSCDPLPINSGAAALLTVGGNIVLGTLDGLPIVLDSTDPLFIEVVDNTIDSPNVLCTEED